jgi:hypothetical protein
VPAAKKSPVGKSRLVIPALIITALAIGGFVFWQQQKPKPSAAASGILEKSVAVLPFENLSDDKSNAYFAEGIQDEILTKLASVADLKASPELPPPNTRANRKI